MSRVTRRTIALLSSAPLVLLAGTQTSWAHGKPESITQGASVQGTVTALDSGSLQLQTVTGSVTVNLTDQTRVLRLVHGSTADLHTNQHIELHFVSGSTVVDAIQIDAAVLTKDAPDRKPTGPRPPEPKHISPHPPSTHTPSAHPAFPTKEAGDITVVGSNTISVRAGHGKPMTFNLSASVSVTKLMNGTLGDLGIGETVRVLRGHTGASLVTIVNA